jgi:hypothetical protein
VTGFASRPAGDCKERAQSDLLVEDAAGSKEMNSATGNASRPRHAQPAELLHSFTRLPADLAYDAWLEITGAAIEKLLDLAESDRELAARYLDNLSDQARWLVTPAARSYAQRLRAGTDPRKLAADFARLRAEAHED